MSNEIDPVTAEEMEERSNRTPFRSANGIQLTVMESEGNDAAECHVIAMSFCDSLEQFEGALAELWPMERAAYRRRPYIMKVRGRKKWVCRARFSIMRESWLADHELPQPDMEAKSIADLVYEKEAGDG